MPERIAVIDRLTNGFYSVGEVRLLSGVPESVSRRFVKSYKGTHGLWGGGDQRLAGNAYLTFRDLLEIRHIYAFHTAGVSWQRITMAARRAKLRFDSDYPFSDLRFKTDCVHIFSAIGTNLELLSGHGQMAFKQILGDYLFDPVDYHRYEPVCWYPAEEWGMTNVGREVMVNPRVAFGAPVIVGSHIPTQVLYLNYKAELNDMELVALNYEIPRASVEHAIAFQEELLARYASDAVQALSSQAMVSVKGAL